MKKRLTSRTTFFLPSAEIVVFFCVGCGSFGMAARPSQKGLLHDDCPSCEKSDGRELVRYRVVAGEVGKLKERAMRSKGVASLARSCHRRIEGTELPLGLILQAFEDEDGADIAKRGQS